MKVYDATDMILGRLASVVAKQALLGEEIKIVNSEKAVISGSKAGILAKALNAIDRGGPVNGPFIPRLPDRYVRRNIRGMLPHKQPRGIEAYKRILCFVGFPESLKKEKVIVIKEASRSKLPTLKYVYVGEICKLLGGKV